MQTRILAGWRVNGRQGNEWKCMWHGTLLLAWKDWVREQAQETSNMKATTCLESAILSWLNELGWTEPVWEWR